MKIKIQSAEIMNRKLQYENSVWFLHRKNCLNLLLIDFLFNVKAEIKSHVTKLNEKNCLNIKTLNIIESSIVIGSLCGA